MHRTEFDDDEAEILAGTSVSSSGPPQGATIVPFPRRAIAAAFLGSAAGGDPPSPPASFETIGSLVQAVVLRLANDEVRLKVAGPGLEEVGDDRDQR